MNFKTVFPTYSLQPYSPPTCTTPAIPPQVLFPIGVQGINDGSEVTGVNFNLEFTNCSSNLTKIRYQVNAVGTSPNAALGLLPSSPNTSVAIQVRHKPPPFTLHQDIHLGNWYEIASTGASSYSVPMHASYYRIGAPGTAVAGDVNTAMTITTEYQ